MNFDNAGENGTDCYNCIYIHRTSLSKIYTVAYSEFHFQILSEETCHISQMQEKLFGKVAFIAINLLDKIL